VGSHAGRLTSRPSRAFLDADVLVTNNPNVKSGTLPTTTAFQWRAPAVVQTIVLQMAAARIRRRELQQVQHALPQPVAPRRLPHSSGKEITAHFPAVRQALEKPGLRDTQLVRHFRRPGTFLVAWATGKFHMKIRKPNRRSSMPTRANDFINANSAPPPTST
jgi:hypothetical protein